MKAALVIAGAGSGSGKTTVTVGLLEALRLMGFKVQPFKAGPDYIDPILHAAVLGRPSYNLDTWMMGPDEAASTFRSRSAQADVGVVEGVMGLFDGLGASSDLGSTAHLARLLNLPVLLVVNAARTGRSVAALLKGFKEFDPRVDVKWVLFNMVGSASHAALLEEAARSVPGVRCVGSIFRDPSLALAERHLGLCLPADSPNEWKRFKGAAARAVRSAVDIKRLISEARFASPARRQAAGPCQSTPAICRVAVARDAAFSFYYEENLDLLRAFGAELVPFSPLNDERLPKGTSAVYLGGGYPELFAEELEANSAMRSLVKGAALSGMPVFAECGGFIYLGRSLAPRTGRMRRMAALFPFSFKMGDRRRSLGYRRARSVGSCPFLGAGRSVRGHEFHYSEIINPDAKARKAMAVSSPAGKKAYDESAGYSVGSTLAGYCHLHFASNPDFARGFVRRAAAYRASSKG